MGRARALVYFPFQNNRRKPWGNSSEEWIRLELFPQERAGRPVCALAAPVTLPAGLTRIEILAIDEMTRPRLLEALRVLLTASTCATAVAFDNALPANELLAAPRARPVGAGGLGTAAALRLRGGSGLGWGSPQQQQGGIFGSGGGGSPLGTQFGASPAGQQQGQGSFNPFTQSQQQQVLHPSLAPQPPSCLAHPYGLLRAMCASSAGLLISPPVLPQGQATGFGASPAGQQQLSPLGVASSGFGQATQATPWNPFNAPGTGAPAAP